MPHCVSVSPSSLYTQPPLQPKIFKAKLGFSWSDLSIYIRPKWSVRFPISTAKIQSRSDLLHSEVFMGFIGAPIADSQSQRPQEPQVSLPNPRINRPNWNLCSIFNRSPPCRYQLQERSQIYESRWGKSQTTEKWIWFFFFFKLSHIHRFIGCG